jgi:hypothetical protein
VPVRKEDSAEHPRRVLAANVGYFRKNLAHMDYPAYRRKGWPIGSGNVESGIKQFNKRVKGTEQFWQPTGVEAILALRGLWLSQCPKTIDGNATGSPNPPTGPPKVSRTPVSAPGDFRLFPSQPITYTRRGGFS